MADKTSIKIRDTGVTMAQVLKLISEGYSYSRILSANPALTMGDIMATADLACQVILQLEDEHNNVVLNQGIKFTLSQGKFVSLEKLREKFPRAYNPWTANEDNQLVEMVKRGVKPADMARILRRQPGAIHARLEKLSLSQ